MPADPLINEHKVQQLAEINRALARAYRNHGSKPLQAFMQTQGPDPFRILVATVLSARTRDQTTAEVSARLFQTVDTPHALATIPLRELEACLRPVGFFRTKARHLKALGKQLVDEFDGKVPEHIDALCQLPGVGRKTANLVVARGFQRPAICVDVHVHRICNRWGLLKTKSPEQTEMTLRRILPRRYWINWNTYLVSFGQTICTPRFPLCSKCSLRSFCDQIDVIPKRPAPCAHAPQTSRHLQTRSAR